MNFIAVTSRHAPRRRCIYTYVHRYIVRRDASREGRKNAYELKRSVTARVFFSDSVFRGHGWNRFFPGQRARRAVVNHYLFLCFTLSSGGERNERGKKGAERGREGEREKERWKVGWKRMLRRAPARVIITDFPDLILRTVTRHNSLTQIAHERM